MLDLASGFRDPLLQTTIDGVALTLCRAAEKNGVAAQELFVHAPQLLSSARQTNARLPIFQMIPVWERAEALIPVDLLGISFAEESGPASFHALLYALQTTSSLRTFLEKVDRYGNVVSFGCNMKYVDAGDQVRLEFQDQRPSDTISTTIGFMCLMTDLTRKLSDGSVRLTGAGMTEKKPVSQAVLPDYLGTDIQIGKHAYLQFDAEDLDRPFIHPNDDLGRSLDQMLEQYLIQSRSALDLKNKIYLTLLDKVPEGEATLQNVASLLCMTPRTLQRRLDEQNTSFQELADTVRERLARQYLETTSATVTQIAHQLAFNDSGNFARAFKRWTGLTPKEYRQGVILSQNDRTSTPSHRRDTRRLS